jgi:hypothetical protein
MTRKKGETVRSSDKKGEATVGTTVKTMDKIRMAVKRSISNKKKWSDRKKGSKRVATRKRRL